MQPGRRTRAPNPKLGSGATKTAQGGRARRPLQNQQLLLQPSAVDVIIVCWGCRIILLYCTILYFTILYYVILYYSYRFQHRGQTFLRWVRAASW